MTQTPQTTTRLSSAVQLYGKCGGIGWTGLTVCARGLTCFKQSDYYSQCLGGTCPQFWACSQGKTR